MVTCPKCGAIAESNPQFGIINCTKCEWVDETERKMRLIQKKILTNPGLFKKYKQVVELIVQEMTVEEITRQIQEEHNVFV